MDVFEKAIKFAVEAHGGDFRKGTRTPYIVHPMEAAAIVATMTDDEKVLTAAMLHDTVEDTGTTIEEIRAGFGEEVARLVAAESENKRDDLPSAETWKVRKMETLDFLRDHATREEKMVTLGDKLSNMRAIYRDYATIGDEIWKKFNQKDKAEHAWYYRGIGELLAELSDSFAYKEYMELVERVFGE